MANEYMGKDGAPMYAKQNGASIKDWKEWSFTPHTPEEIKEKALTDFDNICFSFLCASSKIPEDFYPELMALSTGLLNKENYEENIEPIKKIVLVNAGIIEKTSELDDYVLYERTENCRKDVIYKPHTLADIVDRLDWFAITVHQKLSEDFMRKYKSVIRWSMVPSHQKITTAFYAEMYDLLPTKAYVRKTKAEKDDALAMQIEKYLAKVQS